MLAADGRLLDRALGVVEEEPDALIAVVGPTASGKTGLAIALARHLNGEIVSCDSVQIYRGFDLGSGKPTAEERAQAPHHLIDCVDPLDPIDAARYAERASAVIADIRARGRRPIVCGGTFLWAKALIFGLAPAPAASEALREAYRALVEREGRPALHALLAARDPVSAARLHPNDFVRVSRALEVIELTGKPMSAWHAEHAFATTRHPARLLGIAYDPADLTTRIEARVRGWLEEGWVDEVGGLLARGYGAARAMGSVGYREVRAHVDGELSAEELPGAIVRATRVFARRQRTWLHHVDVCWLRPDE